MIKILFLRDKAQINEKTVDPYSGISRAMLTRQLTHTQYTVTQPNYNYILN